MPHKSGKKSYPVMKGHPAKIEQGMKMRVGKKMKKSHVNVKRK